jgi:molybdate transport system substrate-binding protein
VGKLVLWGPGSETAAAVRRKLESGSFNALAMANPRLAPYGQAAVESLRTMGLLNGLESRRGRLVRGENVAQAYQFVATGNADLGFVSLSQVRSAGEGHYWELPQSLYRPIVQQLLVLQESAATRALLQFLASDRARSIIRQAGYDIPSNK